MDGSSECGKEKRSFRRADKTNENRDRGTPDVIALKRTLRFNTVCCRTTLPRRAREILSPNSQPREISKKSRGVVWTYKKSSDIATMIYSEDFSHRVSRRRGVRYISHRIMIFSSVFFFLQIITLHGHYSTYWKLAIQKIVNIYLKIKNLLFSYTIKPLLPLPLLSFSRNKIVLNFQCTFMNVH